MKPKRDDCKVVPFLLPLSLRTDGADKLGPAAAEFFSEVAVKFLSGEAQAVTPLGEGGMPGQAGHDERGGAGLTHR